MVELWIMRSTGIEKGFEQMLKSDIIKFLVDLGIIEKVEILVILLMIKIGKMQIIIEVGFIIV